MDVMRPFRAVPKIIQNLHDRLTEPDTQSNVESGREERRRVLGELEEQALRDAEQQFYANGDGLGRIAIGGEGVFIQGPYYA